MSASNLPTRPFAAFDLASDAQARALAQKIADRLGRPIMVTDEDGKEICTMRPARHVEIIRRPSSKS